jgi:hypothetical protein
MERLETTREQKQVSYIISSYGVDGLRNLRPHSRAFRSSASLKTNDTYDPPSVFKS